MIEVADRLKNVEEYYFSKKLREVAFLKSQGKPIINLGIGSPDLEPPHKATIVLQDTTHDIYVNYKCSNHKINRRRISNTQRKGGRS